MSIDAWRSSSPIEEDLKTEENVVKLNIADCINYLKRKYSSYEIKLLTNIQVKSVCSVNGDIYTYILAFAIDTDLMKSNIRIETYSANINFIHFSQDAIKALMISDSAEYVYNDESISSDSIYYSPVFLFKRPGELIWMSTDADLSLLQQEIKESLEQL